MNDKKEKEMNKLFFSGTYRSMINLTVLLMTLGLALSWCIELIAREMFRLALI